MHCAFKVFQLLTGNPLRDWPCMWQGGPVDSSVEAAVNDLIGRQLGCAVCAVSDVSRSLLHVTAEAVSAVQKEHVVASKGLRRSPRKKGQDAAHEDLLVCKECHVTVHPGGLCVCVFCSSWLAVLCCLCVCFVHPGWQFCVVCVCVLFILVGSSVLSVCVFCSSWLAVLCCLCVCFVHPG